MGKGWRAGTDLVAAAGLLGTEARRLKDKN